jgi:hypothetical protein
MRRMIASLETLAPNERMPQAAMPAKEGNLSELLLTTEVPAESAHETIRGTALSLVARFFGFGAR